MTLHLKNVRIDGGFTGISAPKDARIVADGLDITNTRHAIVLRDAPGLLQSLGLPANTPPEYLVEALKALEAGSCSPPAERIEKPRETRLVKWLGVAADLTGLGSVLLSAQAAGLASSTVASVLG